MEDLIFQIAADPATHRDMIGMLARDAPAVLIFWRLARAYVIRLERKIDLAVGAVEKRVVRLEAAAAIPAEVDDPPTDPQPIGVGA